MDQPSCGICSTITTRQQNRRFEWYSPSWPISLLWLRTNARGHIYRFVTYVITLLLRLVENGGSNPQAFDKVYEALLNTGCTVFNLVIVVYKKVNTSDLDVSKFFVKAREEYCILVKKRGRCPSTRKAKITVVTGASNNLPISPHWLLQLIKIMTSTSLRKSWKIRRNQISFFGKTVSNRMPQKKPPLQGSKARTSSGA